MRREKQACFLLTSPVRNAMSSVANPNNLAKGMMAKKFMMKVTVEDQTK
jgi:hypothetical protein